MKRLIFILFFIPVISFGQRITGGDTAYVIIDQGQSNDLGVAGNLYELPYSFYRPDQCKIFDGHNFVDLSCYSNNNQQPSENQNGGFAFGTPLISMMYDYARTNIYVIHYAKGASYIYDTIGGLSWNPKRRGELFDSSVARINRGLQWLADSGIQYKLIGLVWNQGETDGSYYSSAKVYDSTLKYFVDSLRIATSLPSLKVYLCRANSRVTSGYCPYFKDTIRAKQMKWVTLDGNAEWIDQDGLRLYDDQLHTAGDGCIVLARRVFDAIKPSMKQRKLYLR